MNDKEYGKLASDIYCFADDLCQALWDMPDWDKRHEAVRLVGLKLGLVTEERKRIGEGFDPFPMAVKQAFQKELGIDPDDSLSPWPLEHRNSPLSERRCPSCGTHTLQPFSDSAAICDECSFVWKLEELKEDEESGPFQTIVDEHDGQLDLRATITMPNGFMVEVAIENVMGSADVALYAGVPDDPDSRIPGELVGRWDIARLNERSEA